MKVKELLSKNNVSYDDLFNLMEERLVTKFATWEDLSYFLQQIANRIKEWEIKIKNKIVKIKFEKKSWYKSNWYDITITTDWNDYNKYEHHDGKIVCNMDEISDHHRDNLFEFQFNKLKNIKVNIPYMDSVYPMESDKAMTSNCMMMFCREFEVCWTHFIYLLIQDLKSNKYRWGYIDENVEIIQQTFPTKNNIFDGMDIKSITCDIINRLRHLITYREDLCYLHDSKLSGNVRGNSYRLNFVMNLNKHNTVDVWIQFSARDQGIDYVNQIIITIDTSNHNNVIKRKESIGASYGIEQQGNDTRNITFKLFEWIRDQSYYDTHPDEVQYTVDPVIFTFSLYDNNDDQLYINLYNEFEKIYHMGIDVLFETIFTNICRDINILKGE